MLPESHWANSMGDPGVLSNFLNWLIWCCFQCLKVGGAYIWKMPTFSNSFVLSEGNKEHIKRPWRNPFRIYINCISLVSKFVFVPLAAQLGWVKCNQKCKNWLASYCRLLPALCRHFMCHCVYICVISSYCDKFNTWRFNDIISVQCSLFPIY